MKKELYKIGKGTENWGERNGQEITFIVTEDCNLRCKYCYITHKSSNKKMKFEVAKKFIDYILDEKVIRDDTSIILDFIGGEPFLEVELIDEICDYFKLETFRRNHQMYWNYRISISTNGVNYNQENVRKFINKNKDKLSIGITIDGTKEKHDINRVCVDNSGSYDKIIDNVKLWIKEMGGHTKVTFSSDDLKYLKESIIHLWDLGIDDVSANVVYENIWKDGDDVIFEDQLKELADYIIENKLYNKYYCTLFNDDIGYPYSKDFIKKTSCGAGKMLALGPDGKIYPCLRYKDYSLNNKEELVIGDIDTGIDFERVRPFKTVMYNMQSDEECLNCDVATGCEFCQGFNYDEADTVTNFQRAKYICKMHKARVRANNYYWAKLYNTYGIEKKHYKNEHKNLYFILSDDYVNYCGYSNNSINYNKIMEEQILQGLKFAHQNFFKPVFIHSKSQFDFNMIDEYNNYRILHIISSKFKEQAKKLKEYMLVFDKKSDFNNLDDFPKQKNLILNVDEDGIENLYYYVKKLLMISDRVNLNIQNLTNNLKLNAYKEELIKIKNLIVKTYNEDKKLKEINIITDLSFIDEHEGCNAGKTSFAYAPDGNIYLCSAFYSDGKKRPLGKLDFGKINNPNSQLYKLDKQPICSFCDVYHCDRCIYTNDKYTNEVNVPPSFKCKKNHIERQVAVEYYNEIGKIFKMRKDFKSVKYIDPLEKLQEYINDESRFNTFNC